MKALRILGWFGCLYIVSMTGLLIVGIRGVIMEEVWWGRVAYAVGLSFFTWEMRGVIEGVRALIRSKAIFPKDGG